LPEPTTARRDDRGVAARTLAGTPIRQRFHLREGRQGADLAAVAHVEPARASRAGSGCADVTPAPRATAAPDASPTSSGGAPDPRTRRAKRLSSTSHPDYRFVSALLLELEKDG
jgi:hypothetical protein